ncbi:hypothetical protein BLNAU_10093 [Blattamonas nauphoetae]|uniref:Protein kinase domain-containing protein n=1 Tax=Blattamonas nauphoetae TaxID=2049346 RepID=A0ABQ9XTZ6_9EUKA|nr:hypothetical protein BLNAU_10093 [Blattamonas nauphoetae]
MITLSLLLCLLQHILAVTSRTASSSNLQSLLDILSKTTTTNWNEIQLVSIPEGTYFGNHIDIKHMSLELSGERSNKSRSLGTRIVPQYGSEGCANEGKFKNVDDVGRITSSLIGCSIINMSSIGSSCQPQLSHLSQKMVGCDVSLTSSHLSGSTIRDVNNGGSVLCSNSSFSSVLSSTNTNSQPSITLPNGTSTQFDDSITYFFDMDSGDETTSASFSHCHFTGDSSATNVRLLTFFKYKGTITVFSCSFTNHTVVEPIFGSYYYGAGLSIQQDSVHPYRHVTIQATNFTNVKASLTAAGLSMSIWHSATVDRCTFKECGPSADEAELDGGGLFLGFNVPSALSSITNLVFESCFTVNGSGGMCACFYGAVLLADFVFMDCSSSDFMTGSGAFRLNLFGETQSDITRMNFTDCWSRCGASGMQFFSSGDFQMSDIHFLRCKTIEDSVHCQGGGLFGWLTPTQSLTVQSCSFVDCSSATVGGAFEVSYFRSCAIVDCLIQNCYSGSHGAITLEQSYYDSTAISLTRVAFVNNSVGQNGDHSDTMNSANDTTAFVDVYLNYLDGNPQPTFSIVDYFTTCATNSIGMHVIVDWGYPYEASVRVFDDEFNRIGPLLTEKVVVGMSAESGTMELEMKCNLLIESQKYEVTVQKEGDKTEMKGEIEFVKGKGTLTSPSPTLNLDFSTSYTITSIVGLISSSSYSSLSNGITLPVAVWAFNLAATPTFLSFTTPEQPPTLIGAKAHLASSDQPLAFVSLMLHKEVAGKYNIVVEEEGKYISIDVEFEESSLMGDSSNFVVVGDDRLLTHDTTYTINSIAPSPGTGSPFVWMNETITFHIPKSSFDPKKAKLPETKKLLSWLIPLVTCFLVALLVVVIVIVLLRRRNMKAETSLKEMEEQTDDRIEEKVEIEGVAPDNTNALVHAEAISHSNFGPGSSVVPSKVGPQQSSKSDSLSELVEVMMCSGDFAVSTARMDTTLYSLIHAQKQAIRKRTIGLQIVNGLKQVVAHRGQSDVLTQLSPHWILLDCAGNVHLKLQQSSTEAEQAAFLAQKQQNPNAVGAEAEKSGVDGLRWKAPEVAAGRGQVDGSMASVFSLGLILWEIETGLVPYGELDAIVAQRQSGTGIGPKMESLQDEEFVSLIRRCVLVDPKERPTLTEIGEFLSSHRNESGIAESNNEAKAQVG